MTNEQEITNIKGEVDELKRQLEELKRPTIIDKEKYQDKIINASGEITALYLGSELYPLVDTITTELDRLAHVEVVASDVLKSSADTLRQSTSSTYEKLKEIKVEYHGTMRIYFEMQSPAGDIVYVTVAKNGTPVGTEYNITTGGGMDYKTQDIAGWEQDDLCQLYAKKGDSTWCNIQNFRIYYDHQFREDYGSYPAPTVNTN